jgi:hypothetical protein
MSNAIKLILFFAKTIAVLKGVWKLPEMVSDAKYLRSYHSENSRKKRAEIFIDLFLWLLKYGEVNTHYYNYGLDKKDKNIWDYMPYNTLIRLREYGNHRRGKGKENNYTILLRDKYIYSQFYNSLGFNVPKTDFILGGTEILDPSTGSKTIIENFQTFIKRDSTFYFKEVNGMCATGVYCLEFKKGAMLLNGSEIDIKKLKSLVKTPFMLQRKYIAHHELKALTGSDALSTMRLFTIRREDKVELFFAILKIVVAGNIVDNWNVGNLIAKIDLEKGELVEKAFFPLEKGGVASSHPDTNIRFKNFKVPLFFEACKVVKEMHEKIPGVKTIGWDAASTSDGVVVIEGNDNWGGAFIQIVDETGWKEWMYNNLN